VVRFALLMIRFTDELWKAIASDCRRSSVTCRDQPRVCEGCVEFWPADNGQLSRTLFETSSGRRQVQIFGRGESVPEKLRA